MNNRLSSFIIPTGLALMLWSCAGRLPDGVNPTYYPDGSLKAETTYLKNKKTGLTKEYYEKGNIKTDEVWSNNRKVRVIYYNEDGSIRHTREF